MLHRLYVILWVLLYIVLSSPRLGASEQLDDPYFGIELADKNGAVQVTWIAGDHPTAGGIHVEDLVLAVGDLDYRNADELRLLLAKQPLNRKVTFEVLSVRDRAPRKVDVVPITLRSLMPKRLQAARDRHAKEIVYVPKLKPQSLHLAVVKSFSGDRIGFRMRFYPNSPYAEEGHRMRFSDGRNEDSSTYLKTNGEEFHYTNLSDEDRRKLPAMTSGQRMTIRRQAFLELGSDRSRELVALLTKPFSKRKFVSYASERGFVRRHSITEDERRNMDTCLLMYQMLKEEVTEQSDTREE